MSRATRTLKVYLVRHAEPAVPPGRRFLGQADPPLGPKGEEQARRLADRLARLLAEGGTGDSTGTGAPGIPRTPGATRFDAVYTSDLRRCLQTAEIVVGSSEVPVFPLPRLREIDTGLWEDLTFEEAARRYPAEYAAREKDLIGYPFPGGESFRDLQARVVPAFLDLVAESLAAGRRTLLLVGHRGPNRVLLCHLLGLPLEALFSIGQDYCALTILEIPVEQADQECSPNGGPPRAGPFGWEDI